MYFWNDSLWDGKILPKYGYIFQVPFITDGNPHQEGLLDQKRVIYLPYSEDKNLVMELPNAPGILFISQLISSGGEIIFALDKVVHKYWVIAIHQVYTPPKVNNKKILIFYRYEYIILYELIFSVPSKQFETRKLEWLRWGTWR